MDFNQKTVERLSKLSDDELTNLLAEQIRIKKANGTLGEVEKMIRVIGPMLNNEQRTRLIKIVQSIQNQNSWGVNGRRNLKQHFEFVAKRDKQ